MRKAIATLLVSALALAAAGVASSGTSSPARAAACGKGSLTLVNAGKLTIGTDNPAYPPWYAGGSPKGSKWKINDPSTGKGFESAVAYAVAKKLGFSKSEVQWTYVPFNKSFAPGRKSFDFDINQISYTPARAKVVTFSSSYYDVNQAVVVVKGTKIAKVHTKAGLKPFKLGAQLGTTSYDFIVHSIKPSQQPAVFPQNAGAVQALKNKQIDGLVVDLPTAFYLVGAELDNGVIVGQLPNTADSKESLGMLLAKNSPLTTCVTQAVDALRADGTLAALQEKWLANQGAPVLS